MVPIVPNQRRIGFFHGLCCGLRISAGWVACVVSLWTEAGPARFAPCHSVGAGPIVCRMRGCLGKFVGGVAIALLVGALSGAPVRAQTTATATATAADIRPPLGRVVLPNTRWTHRKGHTRWTRGALAALASHGRPLVQEVPRDIATWCPAYPDASPAQRRAFWVGFMSALAKFESTYRADAVGGGGKWYGLLQILPATARGYGCKARNGAALKDGAANLACAARIMAVTVPRDGVIYGRGGRGVAADWGPMRSRAKRADMAAWLRRQSYCQTGGSLRPVLRPAVVKPTASE